MKTNKFIVIILRDKPLRLAWFFPTLLNIFVPHFSATSSSKKQTRAPGKRDLRAALFGKFLRENMLDGKRQMIV